MKQGWWKRNWKWVLAGGITGSLALVVAIVALAFMLIVGLIRGTEVYETAVFEARSAPDVIAALGTPIEEGFFVAGEWNTTPSSGYADLMIPIHGPAGSATIYAEAERESGEWYYDTLEVHVHATGDSIDLLDE